MKERITTIGKISRISLVISIILLPLFLILKIDTAIISAYWVYIQFPLWIYVLIKEKKIVKEKKEKIKEENRIRENKWREKARIEEQKRKEEAEKIRRKNQEIRQFQELERYNATIIECNEIVNNFNEELKSIIEVEDFKKLLQLHQKEIIEIDRNYVKQFVQVSNYLVTKKKSILKIVRKLTLFSKNGKFKERYETGQILRVVKKYVQTLSDDVHVLSVLLLYSIQMVESLLKDDMITFYEIYERFDKLNMFDSQHERDLIKGIEDINRNLSGVLQSLDDLIIQIHRTGNEILNSIEDLGFNFEDSANSIQTSLESVESSINTSNLINGIQTYQLYRMNQRLR